MLIRVVLLFFSLLACAAFLLWQVGEPLVNRFDGFVVSKYQGHYQNRLTNAKRYIYQDPSECIVLLEDLLNDLSAVHKGDRLEHLKRASYETLVQVLEAKGEKALALEWVERWITFDNLDLLAQVRLSRMLYLMPGREIEGEKIIESLYKKVPESRLIANEYAKRLFDKGKIAEAFITANKAYNSQDSLSGQSWQIFWATKEGFSGKQKKDVTPSIEGDGILSLPVELPDGVVALRIDPPMLSHIYITEPRLIRVVGNEERIMNIWDVPLRLSSDMSQHGSVLLTSGKDDPYFLWTLPPEMLNQGVFSGRFVAQVEEAYPELMNLIAALPEVSTITNRLKTIGENEGVRQIELVQCRQKQLQIAALIGTTLDIFWKGTNEIFAADKKVRVPFAGILKDGQFQFEITVPIIKKIRELRIDFPEIVGIEYTLEPIEITSSMGTQQIVLAKAMISQKHMVTHNGSIFRVIGDDPYFSVVFPNGLRSVDTVLIRGVAK